MVNGFDESGDPDLVSSKSEGDDPVVDLSLSWQQLGRLIVLSLALSGATLLGPAAVIPTCPTSGMEVSRQGFSHAVLSVSVLSPPISISCGAAIGSCLPKNACRVHRTIPMTQRQLKEAILLHLPFKAADVSRL